jgi:hypothetical protein
LSHSQSTTADLEDELDKEIEKEQIQKRHLPAQRTLDEVLRPRQKVKAMPKAAGFDFKKAIAGITGRTANSASSSSGAPRADDGWPRVSAEIVVVPSCYLCDDHDSQTQTEHGDPWLTSAFEVNYQNHDQRQ